MDYIGGTQLDFLVYKLLPGKCNLLSPENAILADYIVYQIRHKNITSKIVRCAPKTVHRMYDLFILQRNA